VRQDGAPSRFTICYGSPPPNTTVNIAPPVKRPAGASAAPGSSASLSSVLVTVVSLLLAGLVIV
jgi:hypothetical protein